MTTKISLFQNFKLGMIINADVHYSYITSSGLHLKCLESVSKSFWSLIRCRNESTMRFWVITFESRLVSEMIQTNTFHQTFLFVKSAQIFIFALKYRCIIMRKIQNYEWIVHAIDSNNNILFNFKTICLMYFWCYRRRQPYAIINIFSMVRQLLIID